MEVVSERERRAQRLSLSSVRLWNAKMRPVGTVGIINWFYHFCYC